MTDGNDRFRALFDQAAVGVALIESKTGRFIDINTRYCEIVGYSRDEMTDRTFQQITHPDDLQEDLENMKLILNGEIREFTMEKRYFRKDGSVVWVNLTVSPMWNPGEEPFEHIAVVEDITDRKQARQALTDSERRFRSLASSSPVGIYRTDREGGFIYVNEKWCRIAGMTYEESLGGGWRKAIHPEDRKIISSRWKSMLDGSEPWDIEYRFIDDSGKTTWVHCTAAPVKNDRDEVEGYVGVNVDITSQKLSEENAHESAILFRQLFETIGTCVAIYEPVDGGEDFVFVDLNPAGEKHSRAVAKEIVGKRVTEVFPGVKAMGLFDVFKRVYKTGETEHLPITQYKDNRLSEWVENTVYKLPNGQIFAVYEDTSHEHFAEEALKESEEKFRAIAEQSTDLISLTNDQGEITYASPAAKTIFGYDPEEMVGRHFMEFLDESCIETALNAFRESVTEGTPTKSLELLMKRKDGSSFFGELSGTFSEFGTVIGTLVVIRDVNARKIAEGKLRESEERLRVAGQAAYDLVYEWNVTTDSLEWYGDIDGLLGYEQGQISRDILTWLDLIHDDDKKQLKDMVELHRTTTKAILYEYRVMHRDGSYRIWNDHGLPLLNDQGKPYKWIGACTDITDRKKAELQVQNARDALELAQKVARLGSWEYDVKKEKESWSKEMFRLFGSDPAKGIPDRQAQKKLIHPYDFEKLEKAFGKAISEGRPYEMEFRITHPNGDVVWVHAIGNVVKNEKNEVLSLNGTLQDITKRKETEEALLASEEKFRAINSAALDAIILQDSDGKIVYWNPAAERIFGYSVEEIIGENPHDLLMPEKYRDQYENGIKEFIKTGHGPAIGKVVEMTSRRKSGEEFPIEIALAAVPISGRFMASAVIRDITDRKLAELDLENALTETTLRTRELEALLEGAKSVLGGGDFAVIARRIFDAARKITGARAGYMALLSEDGKQNEVLFLEPGGLPCNVDPELQMPIRGLRGEAYVNGAAVYENDFLNSRWMKYMPEGHVELKNVLFVPLLIEGKTKGVMGFANKPGDFSDNDVRMAEAFGHQAAMALQNSRSINALQNSEKKHRTYIANAPEGIFITDALGRYVDVNEAACVMTGYSRDELLDLAISDLTPPNAATEAVKGLTVLKETGKLESEVVLMRKDGSEVQVSLKAVALSDDRFMAFCSDITDQKLADRLLLESESKLKQAQFQASLGHYAFFINKNFWTCSEALDKVFGIEEDYEKTVDGWLQIVHPEHRKMMAEYLEMEVLGKGEKFDKEYLIKRINDGKERWVHGLGELKFDNEGRPVEMFGTIQDITDRKLAEEEQEILQAQLNQAQKMETIGRLAGGVAHDFNNLLTAIRGFSDLVFDSLSTTDPIRQDVLEIQKAADSASALTNQLLAFSRKQIVSPKIVDLNKVMAKSEKLLQRIIGEDIDLVFFPAEDLGNILLDPNQADQILVNLAVNSRDAMPEGGKLTIETQNLILDGKKCQTCGGTISGEYVMLAVSDTGQGIDNETVNYIFEPFFSTKEKEKGTGLGLSTVHGIVHQNHGHINVYSEQTEGTCFKIYLPVIQGKVESAPIPEEPAGVHGHETILLVEDQEIVRKLAVRILQSFGYNIIEAEHGGEALAKCEQVKGDIDLLLTDVVMPQMSGKQLHERLVKITPDLRVLYMSGYTEDAIAHHGVLDKGVNFLPKPFRPLDLAQKVRKVLDQK